MIKEDNVYNIITGSIKFTVCLVKK
jgi:hypothetical protein